MSTDVHHIGRESGTCKVKIKSTDLGKLLKGDYGHLIITFSEHGVTVSMTDRHLEEADLSLDSKPMSYDEFAGRLLFGTYDPEPKDPPGTLGYV